MTHILNASPIVPRFHERHFSYMTVHVYDDAEEDIARFFHQAACFIARVRGFAPLSTPETPRWYGSSNVSPELFHLDIPTEGNPSGTAV